MYLFKLAYWNNYVITLNKSHSTVGDLHLEFNNNIIIPE